MLMKKQLAEFIGFTLIELLIAIAILGILSSVAYPYYNNAVMQSRRVDAINTLIQLQMEQEKYRVHNPSYATDLSQLPVRKSKNEYLSQEGRYSIKLIAGNSIGFEIIATPVADGIQHKDICQLFSISQDGPVIDSDEQRRCWNL